MSCPSCQSPPATSMKNRCVRWAQIAGRTSGVRAEVVGCQAEKCLLLPGDDISPNKLTLPPVAIKCVRNTRRQALASFWEAWNVAKQNVPNQIIDGLLGLLRSSLRPLRPRSSPAPATPTPVAPPACHPARRARAGGPPPSRVRCRIPPASATEMGA
jgi:hypothetical protein